MTRKISGSLRYLLHCYWQWTVFACTNVWMWMHLNGGFCSDIDKVMINLKTEEFVLDGQPLQSLQQLIQWVGDFVLYLLVNLPNQVSSTGRHSPAVTVLSNLLLYDWISLQGSIVRPGFGFLRDGASLGMLREMLVMIRIWGLLKPGCLPIYTATSDNQDSMFLLFRLLTKLWLCCELDPVSRFEPACQLSC